MVTETSQLLGPLKQATIKLPVGRELLERIYEWFRGRSLIVAETFEDPSDHDSRSSEGLAGEATASFFTLVAQLARNAEAELVTRRWVDACRVRPASFEVIALGDNQGPPTLGALRKSDEIAGPPHVCVRLQHASSGSGDYWLIALRAVDDDRCRRMRELKSHTPKLAEALLTNREFGVIGTDEHDSA
nr:hypothetical protein [Streptomyces sp. 2231.1]